MLVLLRDLRVCLANLLWVCTLTATFVASDWVTTPWVTTPVAHAEMRLAVVDLQRALNETEDGQQAKAKLQRVFKLKQESLDTRQKDLKKMKDEIEKQRKVLSPAALQQRMEEYQKTFVELQSVYVEYQKELAQKEGEVTKDILDQMQVILRRIGQSEGYTLILERNEGGVVWVPTHLDLTDRVIQAYNADHRSGANPAPAADGKKTSSAAPPGDASKNKKK